MADMTPRKSIVALSARTKFHKIASNNRRWCVFQQPVRAAGAALARIGRHRSSRTLSLGPVPVAASPFTQYPNVARLAASQAYRLRVGDWRVIYELDRKTSTMHVVVIAPRGRAYR
jgi:hypothetical protein